MAEATVLVLGSQAGMREISQGLRSQGIMVEEAADTPAAREKLRLHRYDLVIAAVDDPAVDWRALVAKGFLHGGRPFMAVSQEPDLDEVVEAVQAGAAAFSSTDQALHRAMLLLQEKGEEEQESPHAFLGIVGKSPAMQRVFTMIERVASVDSTVLITGESGTGKELVARAIHILSPRRRAPFVPVNCGAIPAELLESELFGHEKGAFTNAIRTRPGRFELANGGTIFLDEIGEMSPMLQVKLLRILQERSFERVGGTSTITVDIRVVAATNIDIEEAVRERRFREDLFYRLNVIPIQMPPLRERQEDIPLLIDHFLNRFREKKGWAVEAIDDAAMELLCRYQWPGNVRELENVVERMVVLAQSSVISVDDIPQRIRREVGSAPAPAADGVADPAVSAPILPEEGLPLAKTVEEFERSLIVQALERTGWVKSKAAKLLRMNRTTLIEKLKKQGLMQPPGQGKDAS